MRYVRKYDLSSILNAKEVKITPPFTLFTIIATFFYVGLIGIMPGTLGSLAVYPIYWLVLHKAENLKEVILYFNILSIIIFLLGVWAINSYQKATNSFDHKSVVIDEVLGMLIAFIIGFEAAYNLSKQITYLPLSNINFAFLIIFVVFRFYDIKKPFFIKAIDKNFKSAFGVLLDDVLAAIYTGLTIIIIEYVYSGIVKFIT